VLASSVPVVSHPITLEHVVVQLLVGEATQYVSHDVDVAVSHSVDFRPHHKDYLDHLDPKSLQWILV
jgi:hypothetical protein